MGNELLCKKCGGPRAEVLAHTLCRRCYNRQYRLAHKAYVYTATATGEALTDRLRDAYHLCAAPLSARLRLKALIAERAKQEQEALTEDENETIKSGLGKEREV